MKESLDQAPEIKVRSSLDADDIQKILPKLFTKTKSFFKYFFG